jgi:hypothetical protein
MVKLALIRRASASLSNSSSVIDEAKANIGLASSIAACSLAQVHLQAAARRAAFQMIAELLAGLWIRACFARILSGERCRKRRSATWFVLKMSA